MKKVLWLDVDGVLLDYTRSFLAFAKDAMKDDSKHITYETLLDYDLTKLFPTQEDCWSKMREFACSYQFANLPVHTDAFYLHALKNAGYDLRIITQLTAPPHARKNRIANLTNVYGGIFSEIVFTNSGECKLNYLWGRWCGEAEEGDYAADRYILVEDNPNLLIKSDDLESYGYVEVIGVEHPYNKDAISEISRTKHASFVGVYHNLIDRVV